MANDFNFTESGYSITSYDFNFGSIIDVYYILKGTSNNFSSVWVLDQKLYVSNSDALTIIDLLTNTVYDYYTQSHVGRANESLDHAQIIDVNVV